MSAGSRSEEVAEIRELVRAAGLRCTAARLAVMQRLRQATSPLSHAEIADDLVPLGFDKATVFRNLIDLAEAGVVNRSELGDHVWRFELRDPNDPESGTHPHFVCVECGSVTCLSDVEFNTATRRRASKVGRITEVLLKGRCVKCD
jgi:Fur family transcriptional regulator, ferric uptake regulator